jgi:hypothetical protein
LVESLGRKVGKRRKNGGKEERKKNATIAWLIKLELIEEDKDKFGEFVAVNNGNSRPLGMHWLEGPKNVSRYPNPKVGRCMVM